MQLSTVYRDDDIVLGTSWQPLQCISLPGGFCYGCTLLLLGGTQVAEGGEIVECLYLRRFFHNVRFALGAGRCERRDI